MSFIRKIESSSHDLVKHFVKLSKDRSYREQSGSVLVEGKNLLQDLVKRHQPLRIMTTEEHEALFAAVSCERICISEQVCQKISSVESPEGCFAEFRVPASQSASDFADSLVHVVVLDGVQDPGNVGTLLRTALAFGVHTVACLPPCCDVWNPKVIRAAKGAQFDMKIFQATWSELLIHKPADVMIVVADAHGHSLRPAPELWWLVLGNEAHGSSIPMEVAAHSVAIPMVGPVESLNVAQAGAILLYELTCRS